MVARKWIWRFASGLGSVCYCLWGVTAAADSILFGTVTDAITLQPVGGIEVKIEYSGQIVGSGTSDIDGVYRVPFRVPPTAPADATMIASTHSEAYDVAKKDFQIAGGTPVVTRLNVKVFPAGVTDCVSRNSHSVIVGHFLPPGERNFSELSRRVAETLGFALNTRLQTLGLTLELSFEPCEAAKPRTPRFGSNFAKALRADAFLGGSIAIADGSPGFTVSIYVSDAYGLFQNPAAATNRNLDLYNPSGASVTGETYVALLAAVATSLTANNDCVTAITILSLAHRFVDVIPPYITNLRDSCRLRIPNTGLGRN